MKSTSIDYVLGIDIGTGSCKGLAVNLQGKKLAASNSYYGIANKMVGYEEQDPEEIWIAFIKCFNMQNKHFKVVKIKMATLKRWPFLI